MINIPVKRLKKNAVMPIKAHEPDAGFDLTCTSVKDTNKYIQYGTGIAMHIPIGYVGLIFPRSSVTKKDLMLKNSIGVIDSGYLGEISFRFWKTEPTKKTYSIDVEALTEGGIENVLKDFRGNMYINEDELPRNIKVHTRDYETYEVGDRIGQMIIFKLPEVMFEEVNELLESDRGTGGYGSTDKPKIPMPPIARILKEGETPKPPIKN